MPSTFEFCLPTGATSVPVHPVWLHEVKYDGYRLRLEREGKCVRLITRGSHNWADRYPRIVEAARKNRHHHCTHWVKSRTAGIPPGGAFRIDSNAAPRS